MTSTNIGVNCSLYLCMGCNSSWFIFRTRYDCLLQAVSLSLGQFLWVNSGCYGVCVSVYIVMLPSGCRITAFVGNICLPELLFSTPLMRVRNTTFNISVPSCYQTLSVIPKCPAPRTSCVFRSRTRVSVCGALSILKRRVLWLVEFFPAERVVRNCLSVTPNWGGVGKCSSNFFFKLRIFFCYWVGGWGEEGK